MNSFKIGPSFIFLVLFSFVILVGGTMPYFVFYIFLLTYFIPFIHCLLILKKINGYVNIPDGSLFTGDTVTIDYFIENKGSFHIPYLEIKSNISTELTGINSPKVFLSLGRKQNYTRKEKVILKRRGYYEAGDVEVRIRDIFGFYTFKKKISSNVSLLVYPEIISLSTFKIIASQQSGELIVHDSAFQDKSRVTSIRNYREGDSIKQIHWKISAKNDKLVIKDYENRGDTNAIILINNDNSLFHNDVNRRLEDKCADTALSLVDYFLNQNIEVTLATQSYNTYIEISGQNKSDSKSFLETLARFRGNGAFDFKTVFISRIHMLQGGSTIIIITPNLDKEMGAYGVELKMRNLKPLFIVITDKDNKNGYIDLDIVKRLNEESITVYILDHNTSIKEALEVPNG